MPETILAILQHKLIPWVETNGLEEIIVARAKLKQMKRRKNFGFTPQKLLGPRVGVRSFAFMLTTAKWPNDYLLETPTPLLLFVIDGKADLHTGDYWLHAAEGQGVFTLGDVPRKDGTQPYLHPDNRKNGFCSTINFSEARGRLSIWMNRSEGEIHDGFDLPSPIYILGDHGLQLLNQLQYHFDKSNPQNEELCLHLLKAFLFTLKDDLSEGRFAKAGTLNNAAKTALDNYDPIAQAQEYIRTHLHEPLTLQNVARQVHLSRTQFAFRFHQETKQTFNEFVTEGRLELAKVLLLETNYTITFVSLSVGYRSINHFRAVFLRHLGISPQEFREENIKQEEDD